MKSITRQWQAALWPVLRYADKTHFHLGLIQLRHASTSPFVGPGYQPRDLPITYDVGAATNSISLGNLINDVLSECGVLAARDRNERGSRTAMPFGHHLVYFPPVTPLQSLSVDGADAAYSPGPPFARRVWASGEIKSHGLFRMRESAYYCTERITNISVKGNKGYEKAFVNILRRVYAGYGPPRNIGETHYCPLEEMRTLVFLREHVDEAKIGYGDRDRASYTRSDIFNRDAFQERTPISYVPRSSGQKSALPDFAFPMTPSAALLFRFSALTQNHHRIHYDKQYCLKVEGYRGLLVHGPLSLILMLETLRGYIIENAVKDTSVRIHPIEQPVNVRYKHIAPLFADEQMVICGKRIGEKSWNLWIEGSDGRLAVRARVDTEDLDSIKAATRVAQSLTKSSNVRTTSIKGTEHVNRGSNMISAQGQTRAERRDTGMTIITGRKVYADWFKRIRPSDSEVAKDNEPPATVTVSFRNTDAINKEDRASIEERLDSTEILVEHQDPEDRKSPVESNSAAQTYGPAEDTGMPAINETAKELKAPADEEERPVNDEIHIECEAPVDSQKIVEHVLEMDQESFVDIEHAANRTLTGNDDKEPITGEALVDNEVSIERDESTKDIEEAEQKSEGKKGLATRKPAIAKDLEVFRRAYAEKLYQ